VSKYVLFKIVRSVYHKRNSLSKIANMGMLCQSKTNGLDYRGFDLPRGWLSWTVISDIISKVLCVEIELGFVVLL
jgi:hypothetical protein